MTDKILSSGVRFRIVPKKDFVEKYAMIAVKFGSDINGFGVDNRHCALPLGTAHFIEHKMFENEDGNSMTRLSDMGAEANAFTTFDMTAYYFTCTENFYENLAELVKMVSQPYFMPESIDRERKIIAREINMYEDDPRQKCYFGLLRAIYGNAPVSSPIAGTEKETEKINADIMNFCYDCFYTPKNIMLIAAGNVDAEKIADIAENNFHLPADKEIEADDFSDDGAEYAEDRADIKTPLFGVGFKCGDKAADAENIVKTRIMLDYIFGDCSPLYQRLVNEKILDFPLSAEYMNGRCYNAVTVTGGSSEPEKAVEYINEYIGGMAKEARYSDIEKIIRRRHGALCMQRDNLESTVNAIAACFAKNVDFLDICRLYGKMINEKNLCLAVPDLGKPCVSIVKG